MIFELVITINTMSTSKQYKFATICSANVNRSMAGHDILKKNNFNVRSFGTGTKGIKHNKYCN